MPRDLPKTAQRAQPTQSAGDRSARRVSRRGGVRKDLATSAGASESRLRLVGTGAPDAKPPAANPTPITSPTDPRWVLAVNTAQALEGAVLPPAKRERLMNQGKSMGLSAFDCSLVLAIIQDRARRGIALDQCPGASEPQLALIPLPSVRPFRSVLGKSPGQTLMLAAGLLALQVLLVWVWLG